MFFTTVLHSNFLYSTIHTMEMNGYLDVVNAEELDLCLSLHLHVNSLTALGKQEVEGVKVNLSSVPLNLLGAAHA